jgi:hypothetical protein
MTGGESRFTSDRRTREAASWATDGDWEAGVAENVGVVGGSLVSRSQVQGQFPESGVLDDFEAGELSGEYSGDTDGWSVVGSKAYAGEHSGYYSAPTGGAESSVWRTDHRVGQGHTVEARLWSNEANSGSGLVVGVQDESMLTGYVLGHETAGSSNSIQLMRLDTTGKETLASSGVSPPARSWMRVEFDWQADGTLVYTLEDGAGNQVEQLTANDTTYSSGGIGWRGRVGIHKPAELFVDDARVI